VNISSLLKRVFGYVCAAIGSIELVKRLFSVWCRRRYICFAGETSSMLSELQTRSTAFSGHRSRYRFFNAQVLNSDGRKMERQRIDEYYDAEGRLHSFACTGHMDSIRFRDRCERLFSARPKVVRYMWRKQTWVGKNAGRKYSRGYTTQATSPYYQYGAKPVTIGLMNPKGD
jgi:hypothetical protein